MILLRRNVRYTIRVTHNGPAPGETHRHLGAREVQDWFRGLAWRGREWRRTACVEVESEDDGSTQHYYP